MANKICWWEPRIGTEELGHIQAVLESNYVNDGPVTRKFEQRLAELHGCRYAIGVTSGTIALYAALEAVGVSHGDEVIVPDVTFIATASAVKLAGASPVLVDIDPMTMNISPDGIRKAISPKTKAIVPVHVSGRSADLEAIGRIAAEHGIDVVEDAAEALMSKKDGKCLGTFGRAGILSFSPNKTITTGQGGAVLTDDEEVYIRIRELKDQGRSVQGTGGDDVHTAVGYNFKLTNLQAAVGMGQLSLLDDRLERMKSMYRIYDERLKEVEGITVLPFDTEGGETPQWVDVIADDREGLTAFLEKNEIFCRNFWFPIHTQPPYKQDDDLFPVSTSITKKALWLPSAYTLSDADIEHVCTFVKQYYS